MLRISRDSIDLVTFEAPLLFSLIEPLVIVVLIARGLTGGANTNTQFTLPWVRESSVCFPAASDGAEERSNFERIDPRLQH